MSSDDFFFLTVTGSIDTIRIWDVESGLPLQRMSTGRLEKNLETTVWSVTILKDFTIVSGDSRGKTSFWNGKTGTLIDSYQSHKADILTVAANEEENVVYSSGVDPSIVHFQPLKKGEGKSKWMKSINRNVNTHDVHAILALAGTRGIASVGVDGNLFVDDPKFKSLKKYPPFQWGNNVSVAPDAGLFALKYDNNIEVWSLDNNDDQPPTKVLDIKVKEVESIANSAIAPNGSIQWFFGSLRRRSDNMLFRIGNGRASLTRVTARLFLGPVNFGIEDMAVPWFRGQWRWLRLLIAAA